MAHVFISHIHEEAKLAEAIKRFLDTTIKLPVNLVTLKPIQPQIFVSSEPGAIMPGEDWLARLKQALTSAKVVIPLLTQESLKRPWVNLEVGAAWIADKKIIPVWCEEEFFKGNLPKPYADWQIVHLPKRADDLRKAVEEYLGAPPSRPPRLIPADPMEKLQEAFNQFNKMGVDRDAPAALLEKMRSRPSRLQQDHINNKTF